MDNETIIAQFGKIEKRIESLITTNQALESANQELKGKVEQLETELRQRAESESRNDEVNTLIRNKIEGLMERLEGITDTEA